MTLFPLICALKYLHRFTERLLDVAATHKAVGFNHSEDLIFFPVTLDWCLTGANNPNELINCIGTHGFYSHTAADPPSSLNPLPPAPEITAVLFTCTQCPFQTLPFPSCPAAGTKELFSLIHHWNVHLPSTAATAASYSLSKPPVFVLSQHLPFTCLCMSSPVTVCQRRRRQPQWPLGLFGPLFDCNPLVYNSIIFITNCGPKNVRCIILWSRTKPKEEGLYQVRGRDRPGPLEEKH